MERVTLHSEGTPLCSFKSAASVPIRSLKAHFTPTQNGSGDPSPSNVREIVGRTGVTVYRTAKNLLDPEKKRYPGPSNMRFYCGIDGFDGLLLNAGTYTLSYKGQETLSGIYVLNMAWETLAYKYNTKALTFTLSQQTTVCFNYYLAGGDVGNDISLYQLEVGSSATDYEPYTEISTQVTFPSNGKNRVDRSTGWTNGCYEENTGRILTNGSGYRDNKYIAVIPGENYTMSWSVYGFNMRVVFYNADKRVTRTANYSTQTGSTFTVADDEYYIRICQTTNTNYGIPEGLQIEHGSTATTYEAYSSDNTFYGGYVDSVNGIIAEAYGIVDLGTLTFGTLDGVYYCSIYDCDKTGRFYCTNYPRTTAGIGQMADKTFTTASGAASSIWFKDTDYADAAEFKEAMSGVMLCYARSTLKYYPMDQISLNSFEGQNYIWSSADEKVEVDYDLFETRMIQDAKRRMLANNQPHLESKTGSIVSFTPQVRAPIKELKCEFTPIQDLHGYDHPWPAGGGKNILDMADENIEIRKYINNSGSILGNNNNFYNSKYIPVKADTAYTLSMSESVSYCSIMEYDSSKGFIKRTLFGDGTTAGKVSSATVTMSSTTAYILIGSNIKSATIDLTDVQAISWRVEEGSTATSWEPYENVCPIDEWTQVNVTYARKNIFSINDWEVEKSAQSGIYWENGSLIVKTVAYSENKNWYYLPKSGYEYKLSAHATTKSISDSRAKFAIRCVDNAGIVRGQTSVVLTSVDYEQNIELAIPSSTVFIQIGNWDYSGYVELSNIQLEIGSVATDYESYPGEVYNIEFPATKNLFNPNAEFTISGGYAYWKYLDTEDDCIVSLILKDSSVDLTGCSFGYVYSPVDAELGYNWIMSNGSITSYNKRNRAINGLRRVGDVICKYVMFYPNTDETRQKILSAYDIQIERGSTITPYEPYGTIYGGYIDLVNGKAIAEYKRIVLDGSYNVLKTSTMYDGTLCTDRYVGFPDIYGEYNVDAGEISNVFTKSQSSIWWGPDNRDWLFTVNTHQLHFVLPNNIIGVTEDTTSSERDILIKAWLDENKPEFVCKLATPIEYQLTPIQLKAFKDQNNIWSDTNGNTTVKYWTH